MAETSVIFVAAKILTLMMLRVKRVVLRHLVVKEN